MTAKPKWFNFPLNLDVVPDEPPVPDYVPEGSYILEVEQIVDKVSQWGNPYYYVRCKVIDPKVHEDFRVHFVMSTTEQALWVVAKFVEVITGHDPTGTQFLFRPSEYIGARFAVDLTVGCFRNQWRNHVRLHTMRKWR